MSSRPIAFFDFDGTLTHGDSLIPFLRLVKGTAPLALDALRVSPWLLGYALHITRNDRAKEAFLRQTLAGLPMDEMRRFGHTFAQTHIRRMLRADTFARLRWHQEQGHRCVLVSASLDVYLEPWVELVGIDVCLASSLESDADGVLTGRFAGANCYGHEKVRRIRALLENVGIPEKTYAYGDSAGDIPMLTMVNDGFRVAKGAIHPYGK